MKLWILLTGTLLASTGCGGMLGGSELPINDFDHETRANEARVREDRVRSSLSQLESSLSDYTKAENKIPEHLDKLVPKYLADIPPLDLPACGRESEKIEIYPAEILREGKIDGARLRGTGRWGYVFNDHQVVIFVDCLKPSLSGVPWYQVRGVY